MRKLGIFLGTLGLFALGSTALAQDSPKAADAVWMKAMNANDLDAIVACYAPDAVMWFPDAPEARGTAAIRATYKGYLDAYTVSDASLTNVSYETAGDVTGSWGNYAFTLRPKKGGDPLMLKGRYTVVMKRIGGKWLLVADHASATPPPPAPAKP
ncbi:MAG TPA: DUF4440 domain-containing protein [Thermoanaerobaculia bacterium]|jgi:uncharacterized protein (TIGR02246 family)